ncbi:MAG: hypothetical protein OK422_04195 [Thaumarchaeota archaeon]|nr:hypothetical protein [Nitrososphaerota archaeon]
MVIFVVAVALSGLALFGFFASQYGCFGPCGQGATNLNLGSASCTGSQGGLTCTLSVENFGVSNMGVVGCTIMTGGTSTSGVPGGNMTFNAGSTLTFTCTIQGTEPAKGSQAVGTIQFISGESRDFVGYWK